MHLSMSIPAIAAFIASCLSPKSGDPDMPEDIGGVWDDVFGGTGDLREPRREAPRQHAAGAGPFEPVRRPFVPPGLSPMLSVLGLDRMVDERTLRVAYHARMRECHPDRLPADADEDARDEANQRSTECNLAYETLLAIIRR
jgi:hypothetical protein